MLGYFKGLAELNISLYTYIEMDKKKLSSISEQKLGWDPKGGILVPQSMKLSKKVEHGKCELDNPKLTYVLFAVWFN